MIETDFDPLDERTKRLEIEKLEARLRHEPRSIDHLCRIAHIYLNMGKIPKARPFLESAYKIYEENARAYGHNDDPSGCFTIIETAMQMWKSGRYKTRLSDKDLRLNISTDRMKELKRVEDLLKRVLKGTGNQSNLQTLAYVKESLGEFSSCLAILSDLISDESMSSSMDLSYIIFKAAVVLMHIGQNKQSIEYLEFLQDDPPAYEGLTRTHVMAFLVMLYEQSGEKYKVFLHPSYQQLFVSYEKDVLAAAANKKTLTVNQDQYTKKKLEELLKNITTSSEIWEILALQAVDRCEYIMAIQFLLAALRKAPRKPKLMYLLAELYLLVGDKEQCIYYGEKALVLMPQNGDLRNLLLLVNPEKHKDNLRTAPVTQLVDEDELGDTGKTMGKKAQKSKVSKSKIKTDEGGNYEEEEDKPWLTKTLAVVLEKVAPRPVSVPSKNKEDKDKRAKGRSKSPFSWSALGYGQDTAPKTRSLGGSGSGSGSSSGGREGGQSESAAAAVANLQVTKRPVINDETWKFLQLAVRGNDKIIFYNADLKKLRDLVVQQGKRAAAMKRDEHR